MYAPLTIILIVLMQESWGTVPVLLPNTEVSMCAQIQTSMFEDCGIRLTTEPIQSAAQMLNT